MKPAGIALLGALALGTSTAHAYCVYNKSDRAAHFGSFGNLTNFSKKVAPGGKECCPYSEKTCNHKKSRTSDTQMATSIETSSTNLGIGTATKGYRCGSLMGEGKDGLTQGSGHGYWLQGSGWAELHKSGDGYVVQVYNADSKHRGTISCPKY
ncbi:hypothetical protein [Usitatibacter palustris]|uniref:Secreted protein n=1 Tax=Usitatibacter palustris TaxID=2732487 RepID=A0A6M4H9T1_9PROT|nr:hypothetical protein [Usitatibacter palustris]QJR16306.1 hypothetical protein DSM104440_03135 [Usitatibacter palustris]